MTLVLDPSVRDAIVTHAREGTPEEVCGVLGGAYGAPDGSSHARTARRVPNVAAAPRTRYELDAVEQFRTMEAIEDADGDVVGFYHSHPRGPPRPSATDEALATWAGYSYVIVSLDGSDPEIGSWRWTGEGFERERVGVADGV